MGRLLLPALVVALLASGCGMSPGGQGRPQRHARSAAHTVKRAAHKAEHHAARVKRTGDKAAGTMPRAMKRKPGTAMSAPQAASAKITPALASSGMTLYSAKRCATCHGPQGQGTSAAPALNGSGPTPVLANPTTNTPPKLAAYIHQYMPLTQPGTLTADEADRLAAYIYYSLNKHH